MESGDNRFDFLGIINNKPKINLSQADQDAILKSIRNKYKSVIETPRWLYRYFWLSVKKKENCLFSRRLGIQGKIIAGYSVRLRVFKFDII